jgi:hypothetical protein
MDKEKSVQNAKIIRPKKIKNGVHYISRNNKDIKILRK